MAWDVRRPGKGNVPALTLAQAGTRCSFRSVCDGARASPSFMEPASRSTFPSALKPEEPARSIGAGQ
jgi:hypothetical protein